MTACTASRFGQHDYSRPPHNTAATPRDAEDETACQAHVSRSLPCSDTRDYEMVLYQPGTHDWVRLFACEPCTAAIRQGRDRLGPGGTPGIAWVRNC